MKKNKILVIEDDDNIVELISYNLEKESFTVFTALSGEKGIKLAKDKLPDLILLDLMLPEIDGLEVCRELKSDVKTRDIPIIMVTAKGEESDVVSGLEMGADDYIPKPFRPRELVARVRSVLRRSSKTPAREFDMIKIHDIEIHSGKREVRVGGRLAELTYTEFKILALLAQNAGWVFSRYEIVDAVKGEDYPVTDRSVDVQIVGLRKKLGDSGKLIETIRGFGYRMKEEGVD
jgi:two-component system, OmpR family, alkaline phosphatase synthesis response regulator PhoP